MLQQHHNNISPRHILKYELKFKPGLAQFHDIILYINIQHTFKLIAYKGDVGGLAEKQGRREGKAVAHLLALLAMFFILLRN